MTGAATDDSVFSQDLSNGVVTIYLNTTVAGKTSSAVESLVNTAMNNKYSSGWESQVHHYMYILPPGTGSWVGKFLAIKFIY